MLLNFTIKFYEPALRRLFLTASSSVLLPLNSTAIEMVCVKENRDFLYLLIGILIIFHEIGLLLKMLAKNSEVRFTKLANYSNHEYFTKFAESTALEMPDP